MHHYKTNILYWMAYACEHVSQEKVPKPHKSKRSFEDLNHGISQLFPSDLMEAFEWIETQYQKDAQNP